MSSAKFYGSRYEREKSQTKPQKCRGPNTKAARGFLYFLNEGLDRFN